MRRLGAVKFPAGVHDVIDQPGDYEQNNAEHSDDAPGEGDTGGDGLRFVRACSAGGAATNARESIRQAD